MSWTPCCRRLVTCPDSVVMTPICASCCLICISEFLICCFTASVRSLMEAARPVTSEGGGSVC